MKNTKTSQIPDTRSLGKHNHAHGDDINAERRLCRPATSNIPTNESALIPSMLWSLQKALSPPSAEDIRCIQVPSCFSTANRETLLVSILVLLNSGTRVSRIRPVLFWDLTSGTWDEKQNGPGQLRVYCRWRKGCERPWKERLLRSHCQEQPLRSLKLKQKSKFGNQESEDEAGFRYSYEVSKVTWQGIQHNLRPQRSPAFLAVSPMGLRGSSVGRAHAHHAQRTGFLPQLHTSLAWWHMPTIPAQERWKPEGQSSKPSSIAWQVCGQPGILENRF